MKKRDNNFGFSKKQAIFAARYFILTRIIANYRKFIYHTDATDRHGLSVGPNKGTQKARKTQKMLTSREIISVSSVRSVWDKKGTQTSQMDTDL